jgi:hypothetical protein
VKVEPYCIRDYALRRPVKTAPEASIKHLDRARKAVSALCAVHCVVMPLIVGSLAAAGIGWRHKAGLG